MGSQSYILITLLDLNQRFRMSAKAQNIMDMLCHVMSWMLSYIYNTEEVYISEVTTQTVYDSVYESDNDKEREKGLNRPMLSSFIILPADIETH